MTLTIGHLFKMARWSEFIQIYEKPQKGNLLRSLSVGHALNYLLPYHIGDLFRIVLSGRKMKNGIGFSLATVMVEHFIDIIIVSTIFVCLHFIGFDASQNTFVFYSIFLLVVIPLTFLLIKWNKYIKCFIHHFSSIFNDKIELSFLFFAWSLISSFRDMYKKISVSTIIFWTCLMWTCYLSSYWFVAETIKYAGFDYRLRDVFDIMFSSSTMRSLFSENVLGLADLRLTAIFGFYILIPLALLFILSLILKDKTAENQYVNLLPYVNPADRLNFLEAFFEGGGSQYRDFLDINQDVNILQDFSAGSDATTMLCMSQNCTFYRKYSFGKDSDKLWQQIEWIEQHNGRLPLPKILNINRRQNVCCYDMEYSSTAIGFFQYIHSNPAEKSWEILRNVLDVLNSKLYVSSRPADSDLISQYVSEKVDKNLKTIKESPLLKELLKYDTVVINGKEYRNLNAYENKLSEYYLQNVFGKDSYSDIHGDLTIENIVCDVSKSMENCNFYLIDPNVGNIHDSMYLDYGKLLQSLHGGYEFMMKTKNVNISGNYIDFIYTRSSAYDYIYNQFDNYILEKFGVNGRRSIYFHEVVHWLRLMPYKLRKDKDRAAIFYAGLILILKKIDEI